MAGSRSPIRMAMIPAFEVIISNMITFLLVYKVELADFSARSQILDEAAR